MIYVRQDHTLFPNDLLVRAKAAQQELEALPTEARKDFIKKKAGLWREFGAYLARMSYGKCWYSESPDPQSFFDVDHYRPKGRARRSENEVDDGYPWLAFSWENFRLSAGRSNRLNVDEEAEDTVGKGDWFPLLEGSCKAHWGDRCENKEKPVLLDPVCRDDVAMLDFGPEDGLAVPSWTCIGEVRQKRVKVSIERYGLNRVALVEARKAVIRSVAESYQCLQELISEGVDLKAIEIHQQQLRRATLPDAPYSRAARAKLYSLPLGAKLGAQPEDYPLELRNRVNQ